MTGADIVALASDEPIKLDMQHIDQCLRAPHLRSALEQSAGIKCAEDLQLEFAIADDGIDRIVQDSDPVSDDRNYLEFDVARTMNRNSFGSRMNAGLQPTPARFGTYRLHEFR